MFSLLEQHKDGSWWYHPGCTFNTPEEVEECFKDEFKMHPDRPHMCFKHDEPMFQEFATYTNDFKTFHFLGIIHWPKSREGELLKQ